MENRICRNCYAAFTSEDDDLAFLDKVSPLIAEKKYQLPAPTLCPNCRFQRRAAYRNDRNLFERTCDVSGKKIISMYGPDSPVKVIDRDIWWSDAWEPLASGRNYDFSRSFFEQFAELERDAPHPNLILLQAENSPYANYNLANKNCYLCFAGNYLEDSLYCYNVEKSRDCVDGFFTYDSELCYETVHCNSCYNVRFARFSRDCRDCDFIEDCASCSNCFLCFNLQRKEYCILNVQYSKEEYEKIKATYKLDTKEGLQKAKELFESESKKYPKRANHNVSAEDCTGDFITQSRNCKECFIMGKESEDCKNVINGFPGLKDGRDSIFCGENGSLIYESIGSGDKSQNLLFDNISCTGSSNVYYSHHAFTCQDCFGCTNIRNQKYCILNKKYTKEEYENLLPQIIEHMKSTGEWGEFFPIQNSPFGYNYSMAQEYFPLSKEEVMKKNYRWQEKDAREQQPATYKIPETIGEVDDSFTKEMLSCKTCGKNYKIIIQELRFYRKSQIPLPENCSDCRHLSRVHQRNAPNFYERACTKCNTPITTTYPPNSETVVYCEKCYLETIY